MKELVLPKKDKKNKNLTDLVSECLILILQLRATNDYGDSKKLKTKVTDMFNELVHDAKQLGIDNEKIRHTQFALVAFLDETIICSNWDQKGEWLTEPLQLKLFDTFNAGEEFFINIANLRERLQKNLDVLEIYYLCLILGFKGKYQLQSPENLRRIIDDLNFELHPDIYETIDSISPNGKDSYDYTEIKESHIPIWIYPIAAIVLSIIFYYVLYVSIDSKTENVVTFLSRLIS